MSFTVSYKSFNGGELSPDIDARVDQAKYQTGLAKCRNMFVRLEGSASNRAGTQYICPLTNFSQGPARLVPFTFNDEQSYQLLIHATGNGNEVAVFFVKNDGDLVLETTLNITGITTATPPVVTVSSPHGWADGRLVRIAYVGGKTEVNNRWFSIAAPSGSTFALHEEAAVNGSGYAAYTSGGLATVPYSKILPGVTPAMIRDLRFSQSADVLTFTHPSIPPFNVSRISETNWTVSNVVFLPTLAAPDGGAISIAAGAVTLRYRITAIAEDTAEESFPGLMVPLAGPAINLLPAQWEITKAAHAFITGDEVYLYSTSFSGVNGNRYVITVTGANTFTLNGTTGGIASFYPASGFMARTAITNHNAIFPIPANTAILTWTAVAGTSGYNIYRETNGVYSYIGTAVGTRFEDFGYTADSLNTPPIDLSLFNGANEYPTAVGYYQQRLVLAGPNESPEETRVSRIGLFYNFTKSNPTQGDDSINWIIASGQVNAVRHVVDMGKLLIFTLGAVFSIEGDDAGTLRPTAINPRKRADYGIGDVAPLTIGQVAIYVQASGKVVRELEPGGTERYASRDLTSFCKHLFETAKIVSWAYAEEPFGIIWAVREDGAMLGLTYLKEHQVDGWHTHDTGAGDSFLDVSTNYENGETATYVLVSRKNCNGQTRTYCERMAKRYAATPTDGRFVDSFKFANLTNTDAAKTFTLTRIGADATPLYYITATGTTFGLSAVDVGTTIVFALADGTELSLAITGFSGFPGGYWVTPTGTIPATPYVTSLWSRPVSVIDQLWHLNGRSVMVLGDGEAMGPYVVTNGAVTLPVQVTSYTVGLQIIAEIETLEPDNIQGETWADKHKGMAELTMKVRSTLGISAGIDPGQLQPFNPRWCEPGQYVDGELYTGKLQIINRSTLTPSAKVYIQQSQPYPVTILGIYPRLTIGEV